MRSSSPTVSLVIAGLLALHIVSTCNAELTWTGWLGGSARTGWVNDFQPPEQWPEKLNMVWQIEVGTGYGSPLVKDGRVYQHARQNDDEVVWCLDLATGETKWSKSHAVPFKMGGGGEWHGKGPKSSPTLADNRLFTMSITGVLSAWNAQTGDQLWQKDYSERFKTGHPYWGAAASPLVDGDHVFIHFGNDDAGTLVALDAASGDEVWTHGGDGASYSSPILAEFAGQRQILDWNHEALVAVDRDSGEQLWEYPFPHLTHNQNMPTPTVHNGVILLGGENRGIYGLRPEKSDDGWTVKKLWHQDKVALDMSSAVMNGELLYGFSHYRQGQIFCLDIASGEILWQGPGRTGSNVAFLSIPGQIVALLDSGKLEIIMATGDRYKKVATYDVSSEPTWSPPTLLENGVLIKDKNRLTRWSFDRGTQPKK